MATTTTTRIHDLYTVITHSHLQEFIKEVNKFTKLGWKLYGEFSVERDRYFQSLTIKSNEIVWEGDDE